MENTDTPTERKYGIGDYVLVLIGNHKMRGRISRQTETLSGLNEYFIHTIIGTFFLVDDEDSIIESLSENF
jgi:hypothetical protein